MELQGFTKGGTENSEQFYNDVYVIMQRTGQNKYDVLSSSFLSGVDWDTAYRFTGTKNQVKKYISWTKKSI